MVTAAQEQRSVNQEVRTALRHSAVYGLGSVVARAIGFLMMPLYTHYLSPRDYGVLEILDLSMALTGMFLNMGIMAALLRHYNNAATEYEKRRVVSSAYVFVLVSGALVWLLAAVFARPVTTALFASGIPSSYFLIYFSSFTLGYITNVPNAYLQARERSATLVLADTLTLFGILALTVFFIAGLKTGLVGVLLSPLLAGIVRATVFGFLVIRENGLGLDTRRLREMLGFGAPLILSNLALFMLNFSDRFFLKHFQALEVVGIYAVGYKFGYILNILLIQPFLVMWQARMYVIHNRPDRERVFSRIFIFYTFVLVFGALALSLFSREIVRVMLDRRFLPGESVIPVVAFSYVMSGLGSFVQTGLLVTGRTRRIGMVSAAAAVFNLGLNYVLVQQFGMMGAAWATLLGFLAMAIGNACLSWRGFTAGLGIGRPLGIVAVALVLYGASLGVNLPLGLSILAKSALLAALPVIVFAKILSTDEAAMAASARREALSYVMRLRGVLPGRAEA
jgi:O-antigen/teichoic acid export membrane protein